MTVNSNPNVSSTLSSEASVGFPLPLSKSLRVRALIDESSASVTWSRASNFRAATIASPHLSLIHTYASRNQSTQDEARRIQSSTLVGVFRLFRLIARLCS